MSSNKRDSPTNCHSGYVPLDPDKTMRSVVNVLSYLVTANDEVELPPLLAQTYSHFASPWTYEWATVEEYLTRLLEWIVCGPECFIVALCVLRKLEEVGGIPPITQRSVHRIYLTCLMIGVKFVEDETLCNADFAKVGCVSTSELNLMEQNACIAMSFGCAISPDDFEDMCLDLSSIDQIKRKSIKRAKGEPLTLSALCQSVNGGTKRRFRFSRRSKELASEERKSQSRFSSNLMKRLSGTHKAADIPSDVPLEAPLVFTADVGRTKSKKSLTRFSLGRKSLPSPANANAHSRPQAVVLFGQN